MSKLCQLDTNVSYLLGVIMLLALGGGFYARRGATVRPARAAGEEWQRANENSAFYGEFAF